MSSAMRFLRNGVVRLFIVLVLFIDLTYMAVSFFAEFTGIDPLYAFSDLSVPHFSSFQKILMMMAAVIVFIAFTASIGWHKGSDRVSTSFVDRVPYEIILAAAGRAVVMFSIVLFEAIEEVYLRMIRDDYYATTFAKNLQSFIWPFFGLWTGIYSALVLLWDTTVSRLKNRCFLKTTLLGTLVAPVVNWLWKLVKGILGRISKSLLALWKMFIKLLKALGEYAGDVSDNVPLVAIFAGVIAVSIAIDIVVMGFRWWPMMAANRLVQSAIAFIFLSMMAIGYQKIRKGIQRLAAGDLDYEIDDKNMPVFMKRQVADLNGVKQSVSLAVEQQMKSERLKTELITNVSHDIKTPLTSIINYVDLMEKEDIQNEKVKEYLEVLSRQSAKLKKLIEDLVQASKASTGNLDVEMEPTNVSLLLRQTEAEYSEKAQANGLEWTMKLPEEDIYISSDGKLLWRVFDNLLNNRVKYSMPGTRVYVDCSREDDTAVISFRNISKAMLNISADELMERFVRGDSSRNTDGSGLGLSIAQSLVGLLGGTMDLVIDGDLFKVTLKFPRIDPPKYGFVN